MPAFARDDTLALATAQENADDADGSVGGRALT
jgi:hypothetical protein